MHWQNNMSLIIKLDAFPAIVKVLTYSRLKKKRKLEINVDSATTEYC